MDVSTSKKHINYSWNNYMNTPTMIINFRIVLWKYIAISFKDFVVLSAPAEPRCQRVCCIPGQF